MRMTLPLVLLTLAALPACAKPGSERPPEAATTTTAAPSARKAGGCRDLHLYAANDESTQVVIVDVDARAVGLEKGRTKTFDLASAPKGVRVWLDVYLQPARVENVHCTKTPSEPQMAERYSAAAGSLVIALEPDGSVSATVASATFVLEGRPAIEVTARRFDRIKLARAAR